MTLKCCAVGKSFSGFTLIVTVYSDTDSVTPSFTLNLNVASPTKLAIGINFNFSNFKSLDGTVVLGVIA